MKKTLLAFTAVTLSALSAAQAPAPSGPPGVHRYIIERTFPPGALTGLTAAAKAQVNANNARAGVRWIESYANSDQTKTYCVYEGPSEAAIREASRLNNLPVDNVIEVPVTLTPN